MIKEEIREDLANPNGLSSRPLIQLDGYYVMISHEQLDSLIGSLMHLMDLNSDSQYREAMKSEIKIRTRGWLDDEYWASGYRNYNVIPNAPILNVKDAKDIMVSIA